MRRRTVESLCGSDLVAEVEGEAPDAIVKEPDRNRGKCGFGSGSGSRKWEMSEERNEFGGSYKP